MILPINIEVGIKGNRGLELDFVEVTFNNFTAESKDGIAYI